MKLYFLLFSSIVFSSSSWAATTTVTLHDAFQSALKKNETPAIQAAQTEQAEEKVSQAVGSLLPHLTLNGSYTRQDAPPVPNLALNPNQYYTRFTLTQPIFHGLSEYASWNGLKAKARAQKATETQANLNLYATTAQAFYNVLSAEKDLEDMKVLLDLTVKRVKELKDRTKIGRSRKGELLSAEAQVASLNAQVDAGETALKESRENFKFVTALDPQSTLSDPGEKLSKSTASLDLYLSLIEKRPDIISLKENLESAEDAVSSAKGQHLPTIDFVGDYYLQRTGSLQDSKWDAGFLVTIPIFQGGITQSQVRESADARKVAELQLAQGRRSAEKEIRTYYQDYQSAISQYAALEEAVQLSEANYKEQTKDYRYGLVTNLDVLSAMNSLQDTKRSFDKTYFQGKIALISLQTSSGQIPQEKE